MSFKNTILTNEGLLSELSSGKVRWSHLDKNRKSLITSNGANVIGMTISKDGVWAAFLRGDGIVTIIKLSGGSGSEINLQLDEISSGESLNTLFIHKCDKGEYTLYVGGNRGLLLTWKIRDENLVIGPQKTVIDGVESIDVMVLYHSEMHVAVDNGSKILKLDKNCAILDPEFILSPSPPVYYLGVLKHVRGLLVASQSLYITVHALKNPKRRCYLSCEFLPKSIDISPHFIRDSYQLVLGLGESNEICIWKVPNKFKSAKPIRSVAKIILDSKSSPSHRILDARFSNSDLDSILIAHGVLFRPMFSTIKFIEGNGDFVEKQSFLSVEGGLISEVGSVDKVRSSKTLRIVDNFNLPLSGVLPSTVDLDESKSSKNVTFEKLLNYKKESEKSLDLRVSSAVAVLSGAIASNDKTQLDSVFENTDEEFVRVTLQKLPISQVIPLLSTLLSQFQKKSSIKSVIWARHLLIIHHSYLSSTPDILKQLSGWYHLTESRIENLPQLLKLSGRFDLLLPKINVEKNGEHRPSQTYVECDLEDSDDVYNPPQNPDHVHTMAIDTSNDSQ